MFCVAQRPFSDLSRSIDTAAIERRLPYMGCLELTYRCNQSCRHCYCNLPASDSRKASEMPTSEIKRLLDEAAGAGCFWLLLTGGEVLLREDFREIYLHSLRKGMLVEVFTNATLLDEAAAAMFAEFPPLGIDISIYGSSAASHDGVTGAPGSFERTMRGIGWLRKYGVRFSLKTILMTLNRDDLEGMRALAEGLGAKFRYDTLVCPRNDGDISPARFRLSAEEMADLDLREDLLTVEKVFAGFWDKRPEEAVTCGAGVFAFNINPYGVMSPCTMFRSFQYPLQGIPFKDAWARLSDEHERRKEGLTASVCRSCSMLLICSNCPAWSEIEAGSMDKKVEYVCGYARALERKFLMKKGERPDEEKTVSKT
ncbi:MAG: radical SAM protein [Deltaproteobacteria bacterium]